MHLTQEFYVFYTIYVGLSATMITDTHVIKTYHILLNALPIAVMIVLIPLISSDKILTLAYLIVIFFAFMINREKHDFRVFFFGLIIMILSELFFISTGVETFRRVSLFGAMPLWLPFLWAYAFVAIKRCVEIIGR
jgi:hypothetical protein